MAALQYVDVPGYAALILRRTFRHLQMDGGLIPRSKEWLLGKPGVRWNAQLMQWTFPSGATLSFGYYDHDDHYMLYQGGAWHFVGWDEATQFKPSWYRYLFSRTRRLKDSIVPVRIRAASNPGGPSHEFFKRRFISKGATKYFVPSRLEDNPGLDAGEYVRSLAELDPITRAQLLQGDWDAYEGGRFKADWFREFVVWVGADNLPRYHLQIGERPDGTPVFDPNGIPCYTCFNVTVVDPAARAEDANDYTAILTVAVTPCKRLLVLDMVRERIPLERIVPRIAEVCAGFSPLWVGIEADSFQAYIANDARKCEGIPAVHNLSHECKAKLVRATPAIIRAEAGQIYVPERGPAFPWVEDFLAELCLTGETQIVTMRGRVAIRDVLCGDYVPTRQGWRRVVRSHMTNEAATVCELVTRKGVRLRATPNHPIQVPGYGFVPIGALRAGDGLLQFTGASAFTSTQTERNGISPAPWAAGNCCCIATSGNARSAPSRPDITSITPTTTRATTTCPICDVFLPPSTDGTTSTRRAGFAAPTRMPCAWSALPSTKPTSRSGLEPVRLYAATSIRPNSGTRQFTTELVRFARRVFGRKSRGPSIAVDGARPASFRSTENCQRRNALGAANCSSPSTLAGDFVASDAVSVIRTLPGKHRVYNLEVEGCHEFVANGLLVHNCQFTGDEKNDSHDDQVDALAHVCNALDRFGLSGPVVVEPEAEYGDDDENGNQWGWAR